MVSWLLPAGVRVVSRVLVLEVVVVEVMGLSGSWGRPCVPFTAVMVSSGCLTKVMTLVVSSVVSVTGLGR